MQSDFVYIPAEGDKWAVWINLSVVALIKESPNGGLFLSSTSDIDDPVVHLSGEQAAVLRLHLTGRAMSHRPDPSGGLSDSEYFDRHTAPREPQLPNLPDPVIVPPAVRNFDEKVSVRGVVV